MIWLINVTRIHNKASDVRLMLNIIPNVTCCTCKSRRVAIGGFALRDQAESRSVEWTPGVAMRSTRACSRALATPSIVVSPLLKAKEGTIRVRLHLQVQGEVAVACWPCAAGAAYSADGHINQYESSQCHSPTREAQKRPKWEILF